MSYYDERRDYREERRDYDDERRDYDQERRDYREERRDYDEERRDYREERRDYREEREGNYGQPPPPQVDRPWYTEWVVRENRYIFINEETGERQWDYPSGGRGYGGGGYGQNNYNGPPREEHKSHGLLYGALGAAAGLAGGALLEHEGHEVKERWEGDIDRDEYRVDEFGNRVGNDIENFPENAARWTGRKVQDVEDIPQDVEQGFDRFGNRIVDDVEYAPENAAEWVGDKVGGVERFGDNVDAAYDDGRAEGRDDDRW